MYVVLCLLLFKRINNIKNCITKLGYLVHVGATLAVLEVDARRSTWTRVSRILEDGKRVRSFSPYRCLFVCFVSVFNIMK